VCIVVSLAVLVLAEGRKLLRIRVTEANATVSVATPEALPAAA
jgi:hypothetical protein